MPTKIQVRRGTASEWTTSNPVLSAGELGFETDTSKFKIGDGTTNWTGLDYLDYTDARVEAVIAGSDTDDLSEGSTNLYYTDARVEEVITASDTDDLSEGAANLYYTDARADARIAAANVVSSATVDTIVTLTQASYDGIAIPDANTLYVITD
jgi:hypothetical protein